MLALISQSLPAFSQYREADSLALICRSHIRNASERLQVDPDIVESVVYPELMRYSALRDEIESSLVTGLYVRFGLEQGDFSIGYYQMKPSFVESLERKWNVTDSLSEKYQLYFDIGNRSEYSRNQRIARILRIPSQSLYAAAFVRMFLYYFPELADMQATEQVRLISTAYNCGVEWPLRNASDISRRNQLDRLVRLSESMTFHTDMLANPFTEYLSYAALAVEHYSSL